jgi:hypothetical protein
MANRQSPRISELAAKFGKSTKEANSSNILLGFTDSLESVYDSTSSPTNIMTATNATPTVGLAAQLVEALQTPEVAAFNLRMVDMAVKQALDEHYNKHTKPLMDKCTALENRVTELELRFSQSQSNTKQMIQDERFRHSQSEAMTQNGRLNNIIVTGIQESVNENLSEVIKELATKINIKISDFTASRIGKSMGKRPIKVAFTNHWDKRKLYLARTTLKEAGFPETYFNEDLSQTQSELFFHARKAKVQKQIISTWTQNGSIYIKILGGEAQLIPTLDRLKLMLPQYKPVQSTSTKPTNTQEQATTTTPSSS